ncbi:MAG: YlmH/Sll1252 family protein [Ruminococcus sp.]|nr:YlmH/Sll1252 family protein [Ruminococcus sp.]
MSLKTAVFISDEDKLFYSKLDDAVNLCYIRQKPYFFSFMSERRQAMAEKFLKSVYFENFIFYGGFDSSERKVLGLFYDEQDLNLFPVSEIVFKYRKCDVLTHRDFLGALMSLGIERESIGDILVGEGRTVVFVKSEMKDYICNQIFKIGNTGVSIDELKADDLPKGRGQEDLHFIVTSLRLDNVVAAICKLSREKTKNLILSGMVSVDYEPEQNISKILKSESVIVIRGKGKYILKDILGKTKKDRIRISITHFR